MLMQSDADTELALGLKAAERSAASVLRRGGIEATIGLIIACAGVGSVAIAVWFWLTDPERRLPLDDPRREALYDTAAWWCFVIGLCAVGLGLFLAFAG
jgi:hypothetical protein